MAATPTITISASGATASTFKAGLDAIKTELTSKLAELGVVAGTGNTPKGFPDGVSWQDAYKMLSRRVTDNDPATPDTLSIDNELLKKTVAGTQTLRELGYPNLSRFPKGTSVLGAIDALYRNQSNGILASTLAKAGIYDLSAFPAGTTTYTAFKSIEDPQNPGKVSTKLFTDLKAANTALTSLGITSLDNFPRTTTVIEAKNMLEPKATQMLAMVGLPMTAFKDPTISPLQALSILNRLPDSIRSMQPLPAGINSTDLAAQSAAAKRLVAMGYESLTAFAAMKAFATSPVTAMAALAQVQKTPPPADLPLPTAVSTERLFASPSKSRIINSGAPNPLIKTVYNPAPEDRVKANPVPPPAIVTAAQVMAANQLYWAKKT